MGESHQVKYYFSKLPFPVVLLEAQEAPWLHPLTLNRSTSLNEIIFVFVEDLCRAVAEKEKQQCSRCTSTVLQKTCSRNERAKLRELAK